MNRNKREQFANQRSDADQIMQRKVQALHNNGYGQGKAKGQQVDGGDVDLLMEYIQALENRTANLESALNLDINLR